jgi:hypothetical protein
MLVLKYDTGVIATGVSSRVNDQEMFQAVGKRQRQNGA